MRQVQSLNASLHLGTASSHFLFFSFLWFRAFQLNLLNLNLDVAGMHSVLRPELLGLRAEVAGHICEVWQLEHVIAQHFCNHDCQFLLLRRFYYSLLSICANFVR